MNIKKTAAHAALKIVLVAFAIIIMTSGAPAY